MPSLENIRAENHELLPQMVLTSAAFLGALIVAAVTILGPVGLGVIHYRTSQSGIWETMGLDIVNLMLIVPLLVIGGILLVLHRGAAKYFLVLTPVTLFSLAFEAGVGQGWSLYSGNAERYVWLFIVETIISMILFVGTMPLFSDEDVPRFNRRGLKIYVSLVTLLLIGFTATWLQELIQVSTTGNTTSSPYVNSACCFLDGQVHGSGNNHSARLSWNVSPAYPSRKSLLDRPALFRILRYNGNISELNGLGYVCES